MAGPTPTTPPGGPVDGITGGEIVLNLSTASGPLIPIAGLLTCSPSAISAGTVDGTDQDSEAEDFITTRVAFGEISATCKYVSGNATDVLLREHLRSREVRVYRLTEPNVPEFGGMVEEGLLAVTDYSPDSGETDGIRTSSFTLKIYGASSRDPGVVIDAPPPPPF